MLRRFPIIFTMILVAESSLAQKIDEKNFRHFTTREGLSDNKITGLVEDSIGYIWISTTRGLNRFDGVSFWQFFESSQHNPIPDNYIFSMQLLPGNDLAIATGNGTQIISTQNLVTKNLDIPTSEKLRYWGNNCKYVNKDDDGNYGISTKTGFYIFSAGGKLQKRFDYYTDKDIGHSWMSFGSYILKLPDGNLLEENSSAEYLLLHDRKKNIIKEALQEWPGLKLITKSTENRSRFYFLSRHKILVLNYAKNCFEVLDIRDGKIISSPANMSVLYEFNWQSKLNPAGDNYWTINCADKGFYLIKVDTTTWSVTCDSKKYFADHFCTIVYRDSKKRFWIGTNDGFFMENTNQKVISSFTVPDPTIATNFSISSLLITADKIYAGTNNNELYIIDKQSHNTLKKINFSNFQPSTDEITSILPIHPDTIWIASSSKLIWLNTKNYSHGSLFLQKLLPDSRTFFFLFNDKRKNTWIVSNAINSVLYFNRQTRKADYISSYDDSLFMINQINSIAEDKNGNIWFSGDAIVRWNPTTKKIDSLIEHLSTQKNKKRGYAVMSDEQGNIWATVNADGIASISGTRPVHVRPENFRTDHSVFLVPSLFNNKIYLATNNSIGFLNTRNLKSTIFDNDDGMPLQPISSYFLSYDSSDKSVWFACKNTICKISPSENITDSKSPKLKIAAVSVLNDTFINYPPPKIELRYSQNDIKINLSTINCSTPLDLRFAYRIKNSNDTNWIETGTQPMLLFTNLPTGDYKLEIKLYSYNNKWPPQIAPLEIAIKPPFWSTAWFRALIVIFAASSLFLLYKHRIREVREKANLDKQLAEFEMKALHAQMNPHFIFNCLNSIREMILNKEDKEASHYLSKFAQLIRITLNHSLKSFISLQQTIDYLQRYLEMEQTRNRQFSYEIHIDDQLKADEIMIPPMLIQPFLENAIWHGASPGKELQLKLHFLKMDQQLVCIVDDNGMGIIASEKNRKEVTHHSIGISNVKERIQVLNEKYNLHSSLTIEDKSFILPKNGTGTIVKLFFPLNSIQT